MGGAGSGMDDDFAGHAVHGGEEFGREDLAGRAVRRDLAVLENVETVTEVRGQVEVVKCDQRGGGQRAQDSEDLQLKLYVQVVGRFVENHESGLLGEGARDQHALPFTAGELGEGTVGEVFAVGLP